MNLIPILFLILSQFNTNPEIYIRVNQLGYHTHESKILVAFSDQRLDDAFSIVDGQSTRILEVKGEEKVYAKWGDHRYHYSLDISSIQKPGHYFAQYGAHTFTDQPILVGGEEYRDMSEVLLGFLRQQRCGYNPYLDMVCHQRDGRSMFGPMPDSTFVDVSGGWHDAGDQLKYLITGSYATAHMLKASQLFPDRFTDRVNALGQEGGNGIADVLDEAKWGLDWIIKLHPQRDQLFHQVADDRDHRGWKMPDQDISDYGWGENSYRVAYFATGEPQGLREFKSTSTGVANLAGRGAAALALCAQIWPEKSFGDLCLEKAKTLYALGKQKEGYQQGNSYGAPYRYNEDTWADDMEWGAAELYKATGDDSYLVDAKRYARMINTVSWMDKDTADHYRLYPFINLGHFALYEHVDAAFQDTLADYYKYGIEACLAKGNNNPYQVGVPFIWCSNNLVTALVTQIILYEKMTGDEQYHDFLIAQRDWLFGRNPWGTSMFTGIPEDGEYPLDVHTSIWAKTKQEVAGGLVDGPVYTSIFNSLKGLLLNEPDEFAQFQTDVAVYHDDIGDYSTNEPTMDGTAGAILMMAYFQGE